MSSRSWLGPCLLMAAASCGDPPDLLPPAECEAVWAQDAARDFVQGLTAATQADGIVWGDYGLRDGSYVLHAGQSEAGGECVGLWQAGRAIAYASLADEPTLLTPLYGYYFRADWHGSPDEAMLDRATQPPSVRTWLEGLGVESAVIMPVSPRDFPIELSAFVKVQIAVHEAFHLVVQAPRWYASTGEWPVWDRQPDRVGVRACYTANESVDAAVQEERTTLVRLVNTLLDGDTANVCRAGAEFLAHRAARYDMLADIQVARHDSTPGGCGEAEALMELEEGTADYASWTVLYDLGLTNRDRLIQRYQAVQDDIYYLTGAMQLHAVQLMYPARMGEIIRGIIKSQGVHDGSLTAVLGHTLESYCR